MELVIKISNDKPSRIGIKYSYDYLAERAYEDIIRKAGNETFTLTLEPVKDGLELVLNSDQSGIRFIYKSLEYKMDQVNRLKEHYRPGLILQFVHVFSKKNSLMVAKPFRKENFIHISRFEMINI